jgi:hypothetical protein
LSTLERRFDERQQSRFQDNVRNGRAECIEKLGQDYRLSKEQYGKLFPQHIRTPRDAKRLFGIDLPPGKKEHRSQHLARQIAHQFGVTELHGVVIPEPNKELLSQPTKTPAEATA